jgi:probable HAF family extracellular repeat protein
MMRGRNWRCRFGTKFLLAGALAATCAATSTAGVSVATMTDLRTLPGGIQSSPSAINDLGQVVGESETLSGDTLALRWTPSGGMKDLGTLPGGSDSGAVAINDLGRWSGAQKTRSPRRFGRGVAGRTLPEGEPSLHLCGTAPRVTRDARDRGSSRRTPACGTQPANVSLIHRRCPGTAATRRPNEQPRPLTLGPMSADHAQLYPYESRTGVGSIGQKGSAT